MTPTTQATAAVEATWHEKQTAAWRFFYVCATARKGVCPMAFKSILFERTDDGERIETPDVPVFFPDLNLDLITDAITASKQEYNLKPFFYTPLKTIDAIMYRQDIMRDLENRALFENIISFADKMRTVRIRLALIDKLYYKYNKQGWFLNATDIYCDAVNSLLHDLYQAALKSSGLLAFREYLSTYTQSGRFTSLVADTEKLKADFSTVKYRVLIRGLHVKVRKYESEIDFSGQVESIFERFRQGAVKDNRVEFYEDPGMNHVEAKILDLVARLYPDVFLALEEYCANNASFQDKTINVFDREIQFYLVYLEYIAPIKQAGLSFCYPAISNPSKDIYNYEGFDLALANKLISQQHPVVCNDFYLKGPERILVVSGPNQGGKTTFARTFGQLHYLASIGCQVPGRESKLLLPDTIFTHFEKEEKITNLHGKLQEDLIRIHYILSHATSNSIIILNELFASTTLTDSILLSKRVMEEIMRLDCLCVQVSFLVELACLSDKTVSMVSTVHPENHALRSFKILRMPADGLAYALSIAEKYRLTFDSLKERLKS
jgi:DNA mismatch repair ATPase MutS